MFRSKLGITAAIVSVSAVALLTGCASEGGADVASDCTPAHEGLTTLNSGELAVGISDMPPLVIPEGEGGFDGLDADIIKGFAEAECLSINPVNVGATAAVASVEQGRVDTSLGGWTRSKDRAEILNLSDPMYVDGIIIAAPEEYSTLDELEGKKLGIVQGYFMQGELEEFYGGSLKSYPEPTLLAEDLKSGRIDAALDVASASLVYDDAIISVPEPDERVPTSVDPIQTGLPFSKDNTQLTEAFNAYLAGLHSSGKMGEMLEKWDLDPSFAETGEPRLI